MAKEILKDEILSDEELEQVAGGSNKQSRHDFDYLLDYGIITHEQLKKTNNWDDVLIQTFANYGITYVMSTDIHDETNKCYINGKEIPHEEAMQRIYDAYFHSEKATRAN